ncbi:hypothetical protein BVI1335_320091 [Burkholderia vietnamiensis]|nr:hypothetical protein BVI1335_320091 [Burkholderia vietnamiensis]
MSQLCQRALVAVGWATVPVTTTQYEMI